MKERENKRASAKKPTPRGRRVGDGRVDDVSVHGNDGNSRGGGGEKDVVAAAGVYTRTHASVAESADAHTAPGARADNWADAALRWPVPRPARFLSAPKFVGSRGIF